MTANTGEVEFFEDLAAAAIAGMRIGANGWAMARKDARKIAGIQENRVFRSVFQGFVKRESEAVVGRIQVDSLPDPAAAALREAVRAESAACAVASAASIPAGAKLRGAPDPADAKAAYETFLAGRQALEAQVGVSAFTGRKLPAVEIDRRKRELPPVAFLIAGKFRADPTGCEPARIARGWMEDAGRAPRSLAEAVL